MPGRPAGGGAPNPKRGADDGMGDEELTALGSSGKMKLPRLDRGSEDFSSVVKNRLQSYTRTGQACDRCKVRKIRCDALPEGCSHCINLGLECYVTDRVTGRTERRGYMQQLEREKNGMVNHIRELERLLGEKGVEVKPYSHQPGGPPPAPYEQDPPDHSWTQSGSLWVKDRPGNHPADKGDAASRGTVITPNFPRCRLESRPEDSSLGVGWDSRPLSSIRGTTLTIMGTTIDTASFEAPDMDEPPIETTGISPLYNKSLQAFWQSAMSVNPPMHVELPSRDDAFTYAQWYFLIMSSYFPVLHKPTFMKLLARIYDEPDFVPPIPELVQVHMVLSIIYYQYGVRNWQDTERRDQLNELSNKHYHFSLSKFFDLMTSRDLSAIQAMVLMACHTRAFPKPGCGAIISNMAFQRALELNLHRAPQIPPEGTNIDIEMRKRTWWVMISMYVSVTGRRGRPMPITVEEFDVPLPEPINDELLTEDGVDTSRDLPYEWEVGMAMFKMVPLLMEMYSNIYSVRRDTQNYSKIIYALEDELRRWEDELPEGLKYNREEQQNNLAALYTRQFGLEMRLWMRHNSVNPTSDKKMMAENTQVCEETARELLHGVQQMIALKSLDTTWTSMAVYAMSIFSMLVAHWERRFQTTPEKVAMLRQEMDDWMEVLKEASQLLCSGTDIQDEIGRIVDRTIAWIEHDMRHQGAKPPPPSTMAPAVRLKKEHSQQDAHVTQIPAQPQQPQQQETKQMPAAVPASAMPPQQPPQHPPQQQPHPPPPQPQHQPMPPAQQPVSQPERTYYTDSSLNGHAAYTGLSYGDQTQGHMAAQAYDADAMFYSNSQQAAAAAAAAVVVSGGEAHSNPLISFASQAAQHIDPTSQFYWQRPGANTWQDWTAAIAHNQDRYGAGALLSLGAAAATASAPRGPIPSLADGTSGPPDMAAQWPLVMFDHAPTHHHQHQPQQQPPPQPQPHHPHVQHQHHPHHHHGAGG